MIIAIAALLTIAVIVFVLGVRAKDVPEAAPVSPFAHLDERKVSIYENLRDLQFEFRVGKLSDADYQASKSLLQKDLARVLGEIDKLKEQLSKGVAVEAKPSEAKAAKAPAAPQSFTCPACKAVFPQALKFCGECGKPMGGGAA